MDNFMYEIDRSNLKGAKDIKGYFEVRLDIDGEAVGRIDIPAEASDPFEWKELLAEVDIPDGVHGLYFIYHGEGRVQMKNIWINDKD